MPFSKPGIMCWLPGFLAALLVVGVATLDDWYGRFNYMTDAISYLDIAKAIHDGDWSLVFSPYWSIGYPLLVAAVRGFFPAGPEGEWTAVHVVNLVVFVATYLSFLYLLKVAQDYLATVMDAEKSDAGFGFIMAIGTAIFFLSQLMVGTISRVNPDLLVSGIFFLGTAVSLRFSMTPRIGTAVILGLILGFGYVAKAIFLPLAAFILSVAVLLVFTRPRSERSAMISKLACALPAMAMLIVPLIAANSITAGFFTLGESGSLNYAWNVDHVPAVTNWQGGPGDAGTPIHGTTEVLQSPHVYVFPEPFRVTYPPWFNPFYWYEGVHPHLRIKNEIGAVRTNLLFLNYFLGAPALAVLFLTALGTFYLKQRATWWKRLLALWPIYFPSILAIAGYVMVVVELRYLVAFWVILMTAPFVALLAPGPLVSRRVGYAVAIFISVVCAVAMVESEKEVFVRAIHRESYVDDNQWQAGLYLNRMGIRPGDKVAAVNCGMCCTWAKVSGVRIVAEIPDLVDCALPRPEGAKDLKKFALDPTLQQAVFDLFKQTGATVVVELQGDDAPQGPGWEQVPGTLWWVHRI